MKNFFTRLFGPKKEKTKQPDSPELDWHKVDWAYTNLAEQGLLEHGDDMEQTILLGRPCVAKTGDGLWSRATIVHCARDGTFAVALDSQAKSFLPVWYGLMAGDVSFNETELWPELFAQIAPDRMFDKDAFRVAMKYINPNLDADGIDRFWSKTCKTLLGATQQPAEDMELDELQTYEFFLAIGVSAKALLAYIKGQAKSSFLPVYINQIRMGGRDPSDANAPIILDDALQALNMTYSGKDRAVSTVIAQFETNNQITLPRILKEMYCREGFAVAVSDCHPNSPILVPASNWKLVRGMRVHQLPGEYALTIVHENQRCYDWVVVFDDDTEDATVFVTPDVEPWEDIYLTAPGIAIFFWDLAQTGAAWYDHILTQHPAQE